jgi:hypothetical protein
MSGRATGSRSVAVPATVAQDGAAPLSCDHEHLPAPTGAPALRGQGSHRRAADGPASQRNRVRAAGRDLLDLRAVANAVVLAARPVSKRAAFKWRVSDDLDHTRPLDAVRRYAGTWPAPAFAQMQAPGRRRHGLVHRRARRARPACALVEPDHGPRLCSRVLAPVRQAPVLAEFQLADGMSFDQSSNRHGDRRSVLPRTTCSRQTDGLAADAVAAWRCALVGGAIVQSVLGLRSGR